MASCNHQLTRSLLPVAVAVAVAVVVAVVAVVVAVVVVAVVVAVVIAMVTKTTFTIRITATTRYAVIPSSA